MKFVLKIAGNCDPNSKAKNHPSVASAIQRDLGQLLKVCCSSFFCICCLVDKPSSSYLVNYIDELGIPPSHLESPQDGESEYYVVCLDFKDTEIPLIFSNNLQIILLILDELIQIYCNESLVVGNHAMVLDNKARIWHEIFNFPRESKYSSQTKQQSELCDDESLDIRGLSNDGLILNKL